MLGLEGNLNREKIRRVAALKTRIYQEWAIYDTLPATMTSELIKMMDQEIERLEEEGKVSADYAS